MILTYQSVFFFSAEVRGNRPKEFHKTIANKDILCKLINGQRKKLLNFIAEMSHLFIRDKYRHPVGNWNMTQC